MTATKRFGCGEGPQAKREGMTGLRKPQRPLRVVRAKQRPVSGPRCDRPQTTRQPTVSRYPLSAGPDPKLTHAFADSGRGATRGSPRAHLTHEHGLAERPAARARLTSRSRGKVGLVK